MAEQSQPLTDEILNLLQLKLTIQSAKCSIVRIRHVIQKLIIEEQELNRKIAQIDVEILKEVNTARAFNFNSVLFIEKRQIHEKINDIIQFKAKLNIEINREQASFDINTRKLQQLENNSVDQCADAMNYLKLN